MKILTSTIYEVRDGIFEPVLLGTIWTDGVKVYSRVSDPSDKSAIKDLEMIKENPVYAPIVGTKYTIQNPTEFVLNLMYQYNGSYFGATEAVESELTK